MFPNVLSGDVHVLLGEVIAVFRNFQIKEGIGPVLGFGGIAVGFVEGDTIAVVAGVWQDTVGVVQRVDYGKQTATINVEMFGRETPVEISFEEVRKM